MIQLLQLMQLSDGTLPIGAAAHSFGIESLAEWQYVTPATLESFISTYLREQSMVDSVFCRAAFDAPVDGGLAQLSDTLDAFRQSREPREASISMGRSLLNLCRDLIPREDVVLLSRAFEISAPHHSLVFGHIASRLGFELEQTIGAFLHQSVAALISAAQRLMPIGQRQAMYLLWTLKSQILDVVEASREFDVDTVGSFMPLLDIATMKHPRLETRLFLS